MGKYMVTFTIGVDTENSTSLFSAGMGSASDVDTDVGASVLIRGQSVIVGLVHCILWFHPVSDEGQWR